MKKETWADALDRLSPDFLTEAMPHKSAQRLKRGKERTMKQEFSIIRIATGFVATAAVIALAVGSVALISSLNGKVEVTPGESGSSAETAETTLAESSYTVPENQNMLGGTGEIQPVGVVQNGVWLVLRDDEYWYWEGHRTPVSGGATTDLPTGGPIEKYGELMTDGERLYRAGDHTLYVVDSKGNETEFYNDTTSDFVLFVKLMPLGNCTDVNYAGTDPWYYINGYYENGTAFDIAYQPATGKQYDLDAAFGTPITSFDDVRVCGNNIYTLVKAGKAVASIPHPDILANSEGSFTATVYDVPLENGDEDCIAAHWQVNLDTIDYFDSAVDYHRYWLKDGATENHGKIIDAPTEDERFAYRYPCDYQYTDKFYWIELDTVAEDQLPSRVRIMARTLDGYPETLGTLEFQTAAALFNAITDDAIMFTAGDSAVSGRDTRTWLLDRNTGDLREITYGTDEAAETTAPTEQTTPAVEAAAGDNFLGGVGELHPTGASVGTGTLILHDDNYWYWQGNRTSREGVRNDDGALYMSNTEALPANKALWDTLLTDGEQIYSVKNGEIYTLGSDGQETLFTGAAKGINVVKIMPLGNSTDARYHGESPWYYIGGYTAAGDAAAMAVQPENGNVLDLTTLFSQTGKPIKNPSEVQTNGDALAVLVEKENGTFAVTIPHPDAITSPLTDWVQMEYDLQPESSIESWNITKDSINCVHTMLADGTYTVTHVDLATGELQRKVRSDFADYDFTDRILRMDSAFDGDTLVLWTLAAPNYDEQEGVLLMRESRISEAGFGEETGSTAGIKDCVDGALVAVDDDTYIFRALDSDGKESCLWINDYAKNITIGATAP